MTSFLLEGKAARDRCQNVIKCDVFACETTLKCAVMLKPFVRKRTSMNNIF